MSDWLQLARSRLNCGMLGALSELRCARPIDASEAEFRLNSVWAGAWVTVIVCIPAIIYALSGGGRSDRTLFVLAWIVALIGGLTAFVLPWRTIIRSRWRELAFLTWTMLDLVLIGIAAASDGGPESPATGLFFAPIVFVGASYPTWAAKLVGVVGVVGYAAFAAAYGEPFGRLVLAVGGLGAGALMSWWQAQNHERRRRELAEASITDPLTGALNRRGLDAAATAALAAVRRGGTSVALILIDLDDFKPYNDSHGHDRGDELLSWVARQARGALRPTDTLARIGGDEFAVLIPGADAPAAGPVAERIRAACSQRASHCTGVASAPMDGHDFDSLYRAADQALYRAKRSRSVERGVPAPVTQPWRRPRVEPATG